MTLNDNFFDILKFAEELVLPSKEEGLNTEPISQKLLEIKLRVLNSIDYQLAAEYRIRETYNLSKSGIQRSNRRLRRLSNWRQKCLELL